LVLFDYELFPPDQRLLKHVKAFLFSKQSPMSTFFPPGAGENPQDAPPFLLDPLPTITSSIPPTVETDAPIPEPEVVEPEIIPPVVLNPIIPPAFETVAPFPVSTIEAASPTSTTTILSVATPLTTLTSSIAARAAPTSSIDGTRGTKINSTAGNNASDKNSIEANGITYSNVPLQSSWRLF
jgi:hypothetical protein